MNLGIALFYPPVVLARRFATLDQFSGGRVIAGLGQGWMEEEFQTVNVPMKRRGSGLEEYIAAVRAVWGPDPVKFSGRFYTIAESEIGPKPVQAGGPPILIGAFASASLERAARIADGINPGTWSWEMLEQTINGFKSMAQDAGRDLQKLQIVVRANVEMSEEPIGDERRMFVGSLEQIREDLVRIEEMGVPHVFLALGMPEFTMDELLRKIEQLRRWK